MSCESGFAYLREWHDFMLGDELCRSLPGGEGEDGRRHGPLRHDAGAEDEVCELTVDELPRGVVHDLHLVEGLALRGGIDYDFSEGVTVLPAGGVLVVVETVGAFVERDPCVGARGASTGDSAGACRS